MDDRSLGELLRSFRLRAQMTQVELAETSGVSQRDISDLERGIRRHPYRYTVDQLAEALHLSEAEHAALAAAARRIPQENGFHTQSSEPGSRPEHVPDPTLPLPVASVAEPPDTSVSATLRIRDDVPVAPDSVLIAPEAARKKVAKRRNVLLFRVVATVLVAALLVVSAWRFSHRPASPSQPPAAPASQQVLNIGAAGLVTLDPQFVGSVADYEAAQIVFPGLVRLDDHLNVEPWAAARYLISSDGRTYTFTLRRGLQWSNGVPITASDFAFAINRALNNCTDAIGASGLFPIADARAFNSEPCVDGSPSGPINTLIGRSLQVVDGQTLAIHLHDPAAYFLGALSLPSSWAVPQPLISQYGAHWTEHLADAGGFGGDLFKVVSWKPGSSLVLQRNDHFWGTRARLRTVTFTEYATDQQMYADYLGGKGDVSAVSRDQYVSAKQRSDFHQLNGLKTYMLGLNWSVAPFDDVGMRQAFALALNKVQLSRDVFANAEQFPTNHLVPQGMPGYYPGLLGVDGTSSLTGNPSSANALAQAYADDHCGGDLRRCPPVVVALFVSKWLPSTFAVEIRAMWQRAMPGYPITLRVLPFDVMASQVQAGHVKVFALFWLGDYPDPQDWLSLLFLPGYQFNFGQVSLSEANVLLRQADIDQNLSRRLSEYHQAEQLLVTSVAMIPLFQAEIIYVVRPYVIGFEETPLVMPSSNTWQRVYIAQH